MSESNLANLLEEDCLDKNLPNKSSQLAPKTGNSHMRQRNIVAPRVRYEKNQRREEDRWENNINLLVRKSSVIEASVYYHLIDQY